LTDLRGSAPSDRFSTILLIVLLAVMTCLPLLHSGYTTTDDAYLSLGVQAGNRMTGLGDAVSSGRLQHVITGHLQPFAYGWGHYWVMKALAIAGILCSVASMFFTIRLLSGSARLATLAVVFFFAFAQNTYDHNLLTAYPFVPTMALTLFWLSVASWWLALGGRTRLGPVSVILFVCSLLVYENFLVYACIFPVLTAVARTGAWAERAKRAVLTPHLYATLAVLFAVVGFRVWLQTDIGREMMAVEQYVINLDPRRMLKVIERFGSSAFPLHYSRVYRPVITDFYMGYGIFRVMLRDLFDVVDAAWLVKAIIVAYLTATLTTARDRVQRRGVLWLIAFVFIVLTNLPLAVTVKYQTWAIEDFTHGYLTSYFVFFGVVVLLALLLEGLVSWVSRLSRPSAMVLGGVFAVASFVVSYGTDVLNAHVALTERRMYDKWKIVDEWIASPAFRAIPEGSLILAPSLFEHYPGTMHVFDDYWTTYVRLHGKKQVEVLHARDDWKARARATQRAGTLYFLQVTQDRREDASYLVFSPVESAADGVPMASHELMILAHARSDHFRIVGRLFGAPTACRARVFVDGEPTSGTFTDRFGAHVDRARNAREWLWTRLTAHEAAFDPASILITDSELPVDGSVDVLFGKGFHLDEIAYRWSEATAVVTLRNREDRVLRTDVQFEVQAPGLPPGGSAGLSAVAGAVRAQWTIGPDYGKHSIRLEIPPTSTVDVVLSTDAPRIVAPLDIRTLVMRFLPDIRAREVGCEQ
jgi:hypothetical protein